MSDARQIEEHIKRALQDEKTLSDELVQKEAEAATLRRKLAELQSKDSTKKHALSEKERHSAQLKSDLLHTEERLKLHENEHTRLANQAGEMDHSEEKGRLQRTIAEDTAKIARFQAEIETERKEIGDASNRLHDIESKRIAFAQRAAAAGASTESVALQRARAIEESQERAEDLEIGRLRPEVAQTEQEADQTKGQEENARLAADTLRRQLATKRAEIATLQGQYAEAVRGSSLRTHI